MSKREPALLLEDMLEAIDKILKYTSEMNTEFFLSDSKTIDAVVRNLEIIGEAANHLPESFKLKHSAINWRQIVGLRHRIIHDYFGVDVEIIWKIVKKDIIVLKKNIQSLLKENRN
jgi:uncharacterized protein with HEPN domain